MGMRRWLVGLAVFAVTCTVFAPVLESGFVQLDDPSYVTANPLVRGGLGWKSVIAAFGSVTASMWVPLALVSHMADVSLWGLDPFGHHLTNLLLHALNAALVFAVFARLTGAVGPSVVTAMLFALHPLRVESVAWVAERKDLLSVTFGLLTIDAYHRWTARPTVGRHLVTCGLLALALLAKPMLVTLPALLLLLDVWPLGRTAVPFARRLGEKAVLGLLAGAAAATTLLVVGRHGGLASIDTVPLGLRAGNAIVSTVRYLGSMLWPTGLAPYYPMPPTPWSATIIAAAAAVLLLAIVLALRLRRTQPWAFVGIVWFAMALVPVSGLLQAGLQAMADRFTYLPAIGLTAAAVWSGRHLLTTRPWLRPPVAAGALLVVLALAAATRIQIGYWRTSRTLFERTLAVTDRNWFIHANYGDALLFEGALDAAATQYERALALEPRMPVTQNHLGAVRREQGDLDAAAYHFAEALRLDLTSRAAAANLRLTLLDRGLSDEQATTAVEALVSGIPRAARDLATPPGRQYYGQLVTHLMQRHPEVVASCRGDGAPPSPFDLFVTVAPDGTLTEATASPPSPVAACVTARLSDVTVPPPPFAPFHARVAMRLGA